MNLLNPGLEVGQLCDEHLLFEAAAIDSIYQLVVSKRRHTPCKLFTFIPRYHYLYFINKLKWVEERQFQIQAEVSGRRLKCGELFSFDLPYEWCFSREGYDSWRITDFLRKRIQRRYFMHIMEQSMVFYAGEEIPVSNYFNLIYSQSNSHKYGNQKTDGRHRSINSQNAALRTAGDPQNELRFYRDQYIAHRHGRRHSKVASEISR